jgi:hypothetical protein
MTKGCKFTSQLAIVVNLAINDNSDIARLIKLRLVTSQQIDDGQTPVTEDSACLAGPPSFAVWSTVFQKAHHLAHVHFVARRDS